MKWERLIFLLLIAPVIYGGTYQISVNDSNGQLTATSSNLFSKNITLLNLALYPYFEPLITLSDTNYYWGGDKTWHSLPLGIPGPAGATGPTGPQGVQGETGPQGIQGIKGDTGANGTNGINGTNGTNGITPTVSIGTTITGSPGTSAIVTNTGTSTNVVLDFTIPRGDTGPTGPTGPKGDTGATGPPGSGMTNRWLLNGGPILTSDELQVVTAGGLNGVLSNYGARVQLTLSNAASALAQSLSNVLAVGNVSGTGIVMNAQDGTNSHGLFFLDGNSLTNQFFGSASNLVHVVPAGQTNVIWDSGNLATNNLVTQTQLGGATNNANLAANGVLTNGATVALHGTIDNATTAGTATTWAGSNTLAGIIVSSTNGLWTSATNLVTTTSNTLASAIASNLPLQGYKYVIVAAGTNDTHRGLNLLAAYATATTLSPSAISRVAVIVPPGGYDLGSTTGLVMNTSYVDLIGLVPVQQTTKEVFTDWYGRKHTKTIAAVQNVTVIYNSTASYATINQTADNIHIESLTLSNANGSGVAYDPAGAGASTVLRHVAMPTMTAVIEYAGLYIDCVGGNYSFGSGPDGGGGTASGTFIDCVGGDRSFARSGTASGTFRDCVAGGDNGFGGGGGTASGTFIDCVGGDGGFGGDGEASGTFIGCVSDVNSFGAGFASGTFIDCTGGDYSFGTTVASGMFRDCVGGDYSFGAIGVASGTFIGCVAWGGGFGGVEASGTFRDCVSTDCGFGCGSLASGTFIGCVSGGGGSFGGNGGEASGTFRDCVSTDCGFGCGGTAGGTFIGCVGGDYSFGAIGVASGTFTDCTGGDDGFGGDGFASGTFIDCTGGGDSFGGGAGRIDASAKLYHCKGGGASFGDVLDGASDDFNYNVGGANTFQMFPGLPASTNNLPDGTVWNAGGNLRVTPSSTGEVWDAINLPYPASTNGTYLGMSVGTASNAVSSGYATTAGSATAATFADNANTSSNALQLGGVLAASFTPAVIDNEAFNSPSPVAVWDTDTHISGFSAAAAGSIYNTVFIDPFWSSAAPPVADTRRLVTPALSVMKIATVGGEDTRGILTVQGIDNSSVYSPDTDPGDAGRYFVMENNSILNTTGQFANISLQVQPDAQLDSGRVLGDFRLVRETAGKSDSFFLLGAFIQPVPPDGFTYKDFMRVGYYKSWFTGKLGVGVKEPTAMLHLAAGTAATNSAPLKIDPGVLNTNPVSGCIESDGTHLYWVNSSGTRKQLDN